MRSRILGARVIDPASGLDQVRDLYLDGGKLAATGDALSLPMMVAAAGSALAFAGAAIAARIRRMRG